MEHQRPCVTGDVSNGRKEAEKKEKGKCDGNIVRVQGTRRTRKNKKGKRGPGQDNVRTRKQRAGGGRGLGNELSSGRGEQKSD